MGCEWNLVGPCSEMESRRDSRLVREGWFPACIPFRDQPTSRERCYPREIRPCMKPDHKGRRLCRLCSIRGSRIGAGGNAPGSAAARRAGSSADPPRPHPGPWAEPLKARTAFLPRGSCRPRILSETDPRVGPSTLNPQPFTPWAGVSRSPFPPYV